MFFMVRYLPIIDLSTVIASGYSRALGLLLVTLTEHEIFSTGQSREDLSPGACAVMYKIVCWTIGVGVMTSEGIVLIRIYAIWKNKRFILVFLLAWTIVNTIPALVLMQFYTKSLHAMASPADFNGCCCCIMSGSNILIGDWILVIAYESVLLVLLVVRGCQMHNEVGNTALYLAMFRDGAIFYVCIFALSIGNVILISALSHDRSRFCFLASLERVMHSILAGRLLFTLQKASKDGIYATTSHALTTIQFSETTTVRTATDSGTGSGSETVSSFIMEWAPTPLSPNTPALDSHTGMPESAIGGDDASTFFPVRVAVFEQGSLVGLGVENVVVVDTLLLLFVAIIDDWKGVGVDWSDKS
ncbi:uncharacterized protein FOMMEDRAFT_154555 [Fomitiporia mediterranea MF3/22]|uniref:uncharacterized protein n=1 Tax=Fomitiporia mediterranea (strain MF3/22) TaxID=694068 RepID=UPI00044093D6|nr:uncharacterized protein FOMMEDRAFT_154555 [Fomitiporia mediterranea MF3/22]EJD03483.1 hypothetical protein FOMMEDRAFT_154555 [Fomitiporia mediterranea MF3/22]